MNVFLTSSSAGLYAVATQLGERMWIVSEAVSTVLLPRLSHLHADEGKRRRLTPTASAWTLLISTGLSLRGSGRRKASYRLALRNQLLASGDGIDLDVARDSAWKPRASAGQRHCRPWASRAEPLCCRRRCDGQRSSQYLVDSAVRDKLGAAMSTSIAYSFNAMTKVWLFARLSRHAMVAGGRCEEVGPCPNPTWAYAPAPRMKPGPDTPSALGTPSVVRLTFSPAAGLQRPPRGERRGHPADGVSTASRDWG